ncbi:ferritin-like domain-containing protein [Pedobacter heparinus]|uniref:ferritin-like domain-containing protein n=1 Tax=Pedobacter heparinus TaxID=984 RepID=UPI00292D997A|nr:ferritin-like domain-containing protein [Pedobacter heparinus]
MKRGNSQTETGKEAFFGTNMQRRQFIQLSGASALTIGVISCKKDEDTNDGKPYVNTDNTIDFKDDNGLFNYIYALEQLEAAFYIKVAEKFPAAFTPAQQLLFNEIKLHEITHREFFKRFLNTIGIANLEVDFSSIDFNDATAVLTAAKTFEDLGVAAYNDALTRARAEYSLTILSQLVSIEARHAAFVGSQLNAAGFANLNELSALGADVSNGLDVSLAPAQVLVQATKYIKTKLNVINL